MWVNDLIGTDSDKMETIKRDAVIDGDNLVSLKNGRSFKHGELGTPSLSILRKRNILDEGDTISIKQIVGDIQDIHCKSENYNATIQVASQFNLLEMISPEFTPEDGINIYADDYTQGPACAIACGAGTLYRNYLVPLNGSVGQSVDNQINCLEDIENYLVGKGKLNIKNGYCLPSKDVLVGIDNLLKNFTDSQLEIIKSRLMVGVQWGTEVTITQKEQYITQVYCSALPILYSSVDSSLWERFARLILEAAYEATLHLAMINYKLHGNNKVYLTLLGGGAFGNNINWIVDAMMVVFKKFEHTPLDINIVNHREINSILENKLKINKYI